jgi:hypothetical protein
MQHGYAARTSSMDMQYGNAAWVWRHRVDICAVLDMEHGHSMNMQHGGMPMQHIHEHATRSWIRHGHAAWTWTYSMDLDM